MLPSLGPVFVAPDLYTTLPETGTSALQQALIYERHEALAGQAAQSIAAFASLHVSVVFTAALIAHLLRLPRLLRVALWTFLALTMVATLYFGWHYMVDDIAGLGIGLIAVLLAGVATGHLRLETPIRWRPAVPNLLTGARIVMIPALLWLLLENGGLSLTAAALFAAASLTDLYDGRLARRWGVQSTFGALADPFADKLLVLGSLIALASVDRVPVWIVVLIASREVWATLLRAYARRSGVVLAAGPLGKAKMVFQVAVVLALIMFDLSGAALVRAALRHGRDHGRLRRRDRRCAPAAPARAGPRRRARVVARRPERTRSEVRSPEAYACGPLRADWRACDAGRRNSPLPTRIGARSARVPQGDDRARRRLRGGARVTAVSPACGPRSRRRSPRLAPPSARSPRPPGATADALAAVSLAVSEAVTNAVLHAYLDRESPARSRCAPAARRRRSSWRWPTRAAGCSRAPTAPGSASGCR